MLLSRTIVHEWRRFSSIAQPRLRSRVEELIDEALRQARYENAASKEAMDLSRARYGSVDTRGPHLWFKQARNLKRKVHLHVGPTNSGKTHAAIEALKNAQSGLYAAPLRLLAWQISEQLNCSLATGQERVAVFDSKVVSCTVEVCPIEQEVEVAVVDEFQLMSDRERGWAFSKTILGLPAKEMHLCGEEGASHLVEKLCALTGDDLEIHRYERLSPLVMEEAHLGHLNKIQQGDCLVAFSRSAIYKRKRELEKIFGHQCSIVYGALPPETRKDQAAMFNNETSPFRVLVSTDAVGMGLNLKIKRVVFDAIEKFDGKKRRNLTVREIKQIAGRAGRFGHTDAEVGLVTTLAKRDYASVKQALNAPPPKVNTIYVFPPKEFIRTRFHTVCVEKLDELRKEVRTILAKDKSMIKAVQTAKAEYEKLGSRYSAQRLAILEKQNPKLHKAMKSVGEFVQMIDETAGLIVNASLETVLDEIERDERYRAALLAQRVEILGKIEAKDRSREEKTMARNQLDELHKELGVAMNGNDLDKEVAGEVFVVGDTSEVRTRLSALNGVPLTLDALLGMCDAPIRVEGEDVTAHFRNYALRKHGVSVEKVVESLGDPFLDEYFQIFSCLHHLAPLPYQVGWKRGIFSTSTKKKSPLIPRHRAALNASPKSPQAIEALETVYTLINLSLWLSWRFEHSNEERQALTNLGKLVTAKIEEGLRMGAKKRKTDNNAFSSRSE